MTAVEWLKSKIIEDIRMDDLISGSYSKEQYKLFLLNKIEQALEMEKEQIKQTQQVQKGDYCAVCGCREFWNDEEE